MDLLTRARVELRRPWAVTLGVAALTFAVYAVTRAAGNPYNQYSLLADAFLHGRTHLTDPPSFLELARFGDRFYVIDPPAPALFLIPFVAIFGTGADHVLVSCGVGALAVAMLWIAARRLWDDRRFAAAMTALVAFGTNFWWIAADGGFWSFAHTSAVFFMAAALVEATGRRRPWLVGALVGLAGLSRLPVFLIVPLYAYFVVGGDLRVIRTNLRKLVLFVTPLAMAAAGYFAYNQARYGSIRDLGYYHGRYLREPWFQRGRFDISYIPRHIEAIFFEAPVRSESFPYFRPTSLGLALIFTTPAFLYALRPKLEPRNIAAIVAAALVAVPLVTHGATGWSQFGYRYSLDLLPALLLLTASGMRERLDRQKIAVLALCFLVNLWGVLSFNVFGWVA
jgi:hypothetical protein